jgi:hypothetical protein
VTVTTPAGTSATGTADHFIQERGSGRRLDEAETLNRLARIVLAVVPALTIALTAVGSATGGLARLFRDEAGAARASIALIFLSFALAALASRAGRRPQAAGSVTPHRLRLRATMLLVSIAVFVFGAAWAFEAQITVMGTGEAPMVTGALTPNALGATLKARIQASGVKWDKRIVVFAFESANDEGSVSGRGPALYYSKSGPDANGRVDMDVIVNVPNSNVADYPYIAVTAVLGEDQRDCDGVVVEHPHEPQRATETACLTLQRPGVAAVRSGSAAPSGSASPSGSTAPRSGSAPPSATSSPPAGALSAPHSVFVPGAQAWSDTSSDLAPGQRFIVTATGSVRYSSDHSTGPQGETDTNSLLCVLGGGTHHAGLIGLIAGTGEPFYVGPHYEGVAGQAGELYLGINDTTIDDNSGGFTATIQVQQV